MIEGGRCRSYTRWSKISTSPPDILLDLQLTYQVVEERGRERSRLPPARKEEPATAGVEKEEKEETRDQPSKPPAAPRRKKK